MSTEYRPPVDDIRFALEELAGLDGVLEMDRFDWLDTDTVGGVVEEAGRFMAEVLGPLNRIGDQQGSVRNEDGSVTTPDGFDVAYKQYVDAGWAGVPFEPAYGGGGFPCSVGLGLQEMLTSANMAFSLCPLLTQSAIDMLSQHGSEEQQQTFLPKMISGEWTGTMNLTEPQAGSDVGALTTKAVRQDDGSYRLSGTKIYITYGEHSLTDNIVHLVLARTPDAPPGTKGISCFVVPKFLLDDDGSVGARNDVTCVSIEHKLGIHASPTCVLAFGENEGAVGYLIGEENQGMRYMFTMMNNARLSVGLEGLALSERAYQQAVDYSVERIQGRAITGEADAPIIAHPDVRRMLLTIRASVEAMRGLLFLNATSLDLAAHHADEAARTRADTMVALLTPISKGWSTDLGVELTSLAIQVHGGMGYVEETGVAQHFRDARIAPIYEGTNGIQAIDLVGRKLPMDGGRAVDGLIDHLAAPLAELEAADAELGTVHDALAEGVESLRRSVAWFAEQGADGQLQTFAGATPMLHQFGTVIGTWVHARSALAARQLLAEGNGRYSEDFLAAKLVTARFWAEQLAPKALAYERAACAGADAIMALTPKQLGA